MGNLPPMCILPTHQDAKCPLLKFTDRHSLPSRAIAKTWITGEALKTRGETSVNLITIVQWHTGVLHSWNQINTRLVSLPWRLWVESRLWEFPPNLPKSCLLSREDLVLKLRETWPMKVGYLPNGYGAIVWGSVDGRNSQTATLLFTWPNYFQGCRFQQSNY